MSSAYAKTVLVLSFRRSSLVNRINSIGPSFDPCGTPYKSAVFGYVCVLIVLSDKFSVVFHSCLNWPDY